MVSMGIGTPAKQKCVTEAASGKFNLRALHKLNALCKRIFFLDNPINSASQSIAEHTGLMAHKEWVYTFFHLITLIGNLPDKYFESLMVVQIFLQ
jgi:hypothetical protein